MASIEYRNGIIYISAMVFDENLRKKVRKRHSTGLKKTEKNIKIVKETHIPNLERNLAMGETVVSIKIPTVRDFGEKYIKIKRGEEHRNYSITGYENSLIRDVYPIFGDRAIDSISTAEVNGWQANLLLTLSPKRAENIKIPFNGLLNLAYNSNVINENPFLRAVKIVGKKNKAAAIKKSLELKGLVKAGATADELTEKIKEGATKKKDPFSEEELKTLFDEASGMLKNYIQIAFFTAMRPSEMIALTWEQVDLERKFVLCAGAITGKETEDERELNKSAKSVRIIYLTDQAVEAFKAQNKLTGTHESGYIFLTQYCKPFASVQSIRDKLFKKLMDNSKVRNRRLYDLRHSYASINLSNNRLPILFVSEQMGHADASVTLKEYSSYIASSTEDTLSMLKKAFSSF
jgi:integrase